MFPATRAGVQCKPTACRELIQGLSAPHPANPRTIRSRIPGRPVAAEAGVVGAAVVVVVACEPPLSRSANNLFAGSASPLAKSLWPPQCTGRRCRCARRGGCWGGGAKNGLT